MTHRPRPLPVWLAAVAACVVFQQTAGAQTPATRPTAPEPAAVSNAPAVAPAPVVPHAGSDARDAAPADGDASGVTIKPSRTDRNGVPLRGPEALAGERLKNTAYAGIATSPLAAGSADAAGGPDGVGVRVDFVETDSPAGKAGLMPQDVLCKIGDQWVVNPPQLSVLVRLHKPGDTVPFAIVRDGRPQTLNVTLGGRLLPKLDAAAAAPPDWQNNAQLNEMRDRAAALAAAAALAPGQHMQCQMSHSDGEHTITLTQNDNDLSATVADKTGTTLFAGPINTPEEREKIPAAVRPKIERLRADAAKLNVGPGLILPGVTPGADRPDDNAPARPEAAPPATAPAR